MSTRAARLALAALALAGCAVRPFAPTGVPAGAPRDEVLRIMGPPTATYAMPDGHERLEYNRMPFGKHTFMIDLDASGRVAHWEDVLDERHFAAIQPGMTQAEVLQKISNELVKSQITPGSGFSTNLSDADRVFLQQTMPAISNRPESNAVILAFLESAAQRTVDKSIAWDRSDDHSLKAWRNFNADWTEKQNKAPIIQKVETLEEGGLLPVNSVFRLPDGRFGVVTP